MIGDPFRIFFRLMIASFQITGYTVIFVIQILWYLIHRRTDKVADAFGHFGRFTTNAIADVFKN